MVPLRTPVFTVFDPRPTASEIPTRFPSPFAAIPHPLAARAAAMLLDDLRDWSGDLDGGGKMFGVLVVAAPDGRIGFLRAFSGMLGQRWLVDGFVPPVFDVVARDAFWPAADATLRALSDRIANCDATAASRRAELERERSDRSREYSRRLHEGYLIVDVHGVQRSLADVFAPGWPPAGAGDCAAPKLVAQAHRDGFRPLALAELWWGAPPVDGGRRAGCFYPPCERSCRPILTHALRGIPAEPWPAVETKPGTERTGRRRSRRGRRRTEPV